MPILPVGCRILRTAHASEVNEMQQTAITFQSWSHAELCSLLLRLVLALTPFGAVHGAWDLALARGVTGYRWSAGEPVP